jgi:thiosulfate reductase cytochrome b subunit
VLEPSSRSSSNFTITDRNAPAFGRGILLLFDSFEGVSVQRKKVAGWIAIVLIAFVRTLPEVAVFISNYRGTTPLPEGAPVGLPAWLGWQHYLNMFFILLAIRTGWIIRSKKRPPAFWTRSDKGVLRYTGPAQRMGIYHWFHLSIDFLWVINGALFMVLLFATGQWMRIVPTSWDVFPNAVSAALQYASLRWPVDNAWVNYNSLQVMAYFVTVFIAAPLAIFTGVRLSPAWPKQGWLHRAFPENLSRRTHAFVMFYFFVFIVAHVTLVFTTGALRNLNMMFAANDGTSWLGAGIFAIALASMVVAWFLVKPRVLKPIAKLSGKVQG